MVSVSIFVQLEHMAQLTFRLRHAIHAVLTQRLLIVVVPSLSAFLFLFLPFAFAVESVVAFDTPSVGVWLNSSAFICMPMARSSIAGKGAWRKAPSYC